MKIKFRKKELDCDWIILSNSDYHQILTMEEEYPRLWKQLKLLFTFTENAGFLKQQGVLE